MSLRVWKNQGKTKEGFEIWVQDKILEGTTIATTLGNTLVKFQILCLG